MPMVARIVLLACFLVISITAHGRSGVTPRPAAPKMRPTPPPPDQGAALREVSAPENPLGGQFYFPRRSWFLGIDVGSADVDVEKNANLHTTKVSDHTVLQLNWGYRFSPYYRLGLSLANIGKIDQVVYADSIYYGHLLADITSIMLNNYFSWPFPRHNERFSPYIGLGIGTFGVDGEGKKDPDNEDDPVYSTKSRKFTWQFIAGFDVRVYRQVVVGIDIRHMQATLKLSALASTDKIDAEMSATTYALGVKYYFK